MSLFKKEKKKQSFSMKIAFNQSEILSVDIVNVVNDYVYRGPFPATITPVLMVV